ncbi:arginine--tRNA ligase [Patescibacteria group bacterium]|nr:arginine--tRNA ligase [Patescibacteria group bacterium]
MKDVVEKAVKKAIGRNDVLVEFTENENFGDFSTNIALHLGGSPKEEAEKLVDILKKSPELTKIVSKIEVAGPGFINFRLSKEALLENLEEILKVKESFGASDIGKRKTTIVEYSSPNIAKHFAIGHLRSTIIGKALFNMYGFLGYKTIGENHLGDWGTQFGTLLYQINSQHLTVDKLTLDELQDLYVDFHEKAEINPELWDEARTWFKKLEGGDEEARHIWRSLVEKSMVEFERIYNILGVNIENAHGESFYEGIMPSVIEDIRKRKLSKKSLGAEIVEFKDLPPAMLIKSDGTTTYYTRDLAALAYRIKTWDPALIIYEVGSDQILHFRQVFETAKFLGWSEGREFVHIAHGLIRFEHGKMSTRKGQSIKLEEVLDEAIKRARQIIEKSETGRGLAEDEKGKVAKAVGIGAVKYFDLMHHPQTDIVFDWNKVFVLEGNSAPYLQYTVARTNSVLAKAQKSFEFRISNFEFNSEELGVLRSLARFGDVIITAAKNYSPNLLTNYLFDLAQKFNAFYNSNRIIGSDSEALRLRLTSATGQVLKNGLTLLGIETPERM